MCFCKVKFTHKLEIIWKLLSACFYFCSELLSSFPPICKYPNAGFFFTKHVIMTAVHEVEKSIQHAI